MARYEHLPIYKKAMDFTVYLEQIVQSFSRYHKYTLGSELRGKSREIVGVVITANSRVEKLPLLLELRERLEGLQVLLRICKEVRAFNGFNSHAYAACHFPKASPRVLKTFPPPWRPGGRPLLTASSAH